MKFTLLMFLDALVAIFNASSMLVMFSEGMYGWALFNLSMTLWATWHMAKMIGAGFDGEVG